MDWGDDEKEGERKNDEGLNKVGENVWLERKTINHVENLVISRGSYNSF